MSKIIDFTWPPAFVTSCTSNQPSTLDSIPSLSCAYGGALLVSNLNITQLTKYLNYTSSQQWFSKGCWCLSVCGHRPKNCLLGSRLAYDFHEGKTEVWHHLKGSKNHEGVLEILVLLKKNPIFVTTFEANMTIFQF